MLQAPRLSCKSTIWATAIWATALACGVLLNSPAAKAEEAKPASPSPEGIEFFEKHIRPLFAQHCLECHGDKRRADLHSTRKGA